MKERKNLIRAVAGYLLVGLWMGVIFYMSAQNGKQSSDSSGIFLRMISDILYWIFGEKGRIFTESHVGILTTLVRKGAHMTEYAILFLLLWQTEYARRQRAVKQYKTAVMCVLVCCLYAVTDELHQLFISMRSGCVRDVLVDTLGAAIAAAAALWFYQRGKKKPH